MKRLKFSLCKSFQWRRVGAFTEIKGQIIYCEVPFPTEKMCGYSNSKEIGFNLDNMKRFPHLLCFPQRFFHEIIHFYSHNFRVNLLLHKIFFKTRGLVL